MRLSYGSGLTGLVVSVVAVAFFVIVAWFLASLFGLHFALGTSLLASVALTALIHLATGAFRRTR